MADAKDMESAINILRYEVESLRALLSEQDLEVDSRMKEKINCNPISLER